jgi:hypothetical protein
LNKKLFCYRGIALFSSITPITNLFSGNEKVNWEKPFFYITLGHIIMSLDVIHAIIGLVKSKWPLTLMQVFSRHYVNFAIWYIAKEVCNFCFRNMIH